jgi:hypothetical protein
MILERRNMFDLVHYVQQLSAYSPSGIHLNAINVLRRATAPVSDQSTRYGCDDDDLQAKEDLRDEWTQPAASNLHILAHASIRSPKKPVDYRKSEEDE